MQTEACSNYSDRGSLRLSLAGGQRHPSPTAAALWLVVERKALASFRIRETGLLIRVVDGEVLVLDTDADRIHQLNASASFIWRQLANSASAEEIAERLAKEFDVVEDQCQTDVAEILRQFVELGIATTEVLNQAERS